MTPDQLAADRVMVEVDRVIQSNDRWILGDFHLNFIHAPLPFGVVWSRGSAGCLKAYLTQKQCFIPIKNKDNLCCARAIVTAKARLDSHPKWHSIRQGRNERLHLARQLHFDAGNDVLFFSLSLSPTKKIKINKYIKIVGKKNSAEKIKIS